VSDGGKSTSWRPNKAQAIFGWAVGVVALILAIGQTEEYDGSPAIPAIIGVLAIMWALGYRKDS